MSSTAAKMAADEFDRVASTCGRWHSKSLAVVRALLVEGKKPSEVTQAYDVTAQHAGVLLRRFKARALAVGRKKVSAEDFMQAVKPEGTATLEPFKRELIQLRSNGYTNEQLRLYLVENGIDTTTTDIDQYLTKATSHGNPRNSK